MMPIATFAQESPTTVSTTPTADSDRTERATRVEARELAQYVSRIYGRGWCDGTGGNYSYVLGHDPIELLVTRTGIDKGRVVPDDFLHVDAELEPLADSAPGTPSAEAFLHIAIASETGASAIFHTHSVWGTLLGEHFLHQRGFTISGYEMQKGLTGVMSHREQVHVPVLRNSQDDRALADNVTRVLGRRPGLHGFLIAGHGLYTWGESLAEAFRHVEILEFLFQVVGNRVPLEPIA